MTQNIETIRELNAAELDHVGGGLSLDLDLSHELAAVSGTIDQVGGLVSGTVGQVGGLVSGLVGGLLGAVGGLT